MTEMDTKFLEVLYSLPSNKAANSIYIGKQLGLPRNKIQARVNLGRLARLKKSGYANCTQEFYEESKFYKITDKGRDLIKANKREESKREEKRREEIA